MNKLDNAEFTAIYKAAAAKARESELYKEYYKRIYDELLAEVSVCNLRPVEIENVPAEIRYVLYNDLTNAGFEVQMVNGHRLDIALSHRLNLA